MREKDRTGSGSGGEGPAATRCDGPGTGGGALRPATSWASSTAGRRRATDDGSSGERLQPPGPVVRVQALRFKIERSRRSTVWLRVERPIERRRYRRSRRRGEEGSVEHVEVFQMAARTSIFQGSARLSRASNAHTAIDRRTTSVKKPLLRQVKAGPSRGVRWWLAAGGRPGS